MKFRFKPGRSGRFVRLTLTLPVWLLLQACAAPATRPVEVDESLVQQEAEIQREIALKSLVDRQRRLFRVAYPLLKAAVPLCPDDVTTAVGITFANRFSFPDELGPAAHRLYGLDEGLRIMQVIPGSASAAEGLEEGDVLVSVEGRAVPAGKNAAVGLRDLIAGLGRENLLQGAEEPFRLAISRKGEPLSLTLVPEQVCGYAVVVGDSDAVNAFADGSGVVVAKGMLRFAESDQELSLVVAHEIAHNALEHVGRRTANYLLGSVFDIIAALYGVNTRGVFGQIGAQAYSQDFESEADYVGLYIMARAGLKTDETAHFWRRMAAEYPGSIAGNYLATHPASPQRFLAIEKTLEEIHQKQDAGLPLLPRFKE